ncbi:aminotransferase class I/II-fold pyridoxal phosphate-dependent enzyme [Parvicella tangerina]|uniref:Pyridoxal phosphate-dependent acyltransferase n=1 Tax=Parvicella tangerina TaxID=2829795 RepID=A0A916JM95_9FLAO|nr:pyridoxal phosphate-dependent aminotransferase family protein [Parvicella tangerina]CAG5081186.1 Putative pyridoxal phosphate-dependent acyltransferase [Parvicella tangerina]
MDIFERIAQNRGPLGQHMERSHGYFTFPKLEGQIAPRMTFKGKEVLTWSINNYLGLSNHPEVRKVDAEAAAEWGCGYPMGARMMSGQTEYHEEFERQIADFMEMEAAYLLNFGYQGFMSVIDSLTHRNDVIVYDSECHACLVDGIRLHQGKTFVFPHNDIEKCEKSLERAAKITAETGGGILLITEGVFGMSGDQGKLKEIVELRKKGHQFRLMVDDAHGFGTLGEKGQGAGEAQGVHHEIDILLGTFAKSMASIGAFVCAKKEIVDFLMYNMRSQVFAKSLPMVLTIGALKRLELLKAPTQREKLWTITNALQNGLREAGFNLGNTNSCVTPVMLSGTLGEATKLTFDLRENYSIFTSIVVYPVVPKGMILLRLIPTAAHSLDDVEYTIETFKKVKAKLDAGEYHAEKIVDANA